jgi:hypothetical protein
MTAIKLEASQAKQTLYPTVRVRVEPQGDGGRTLIVDTPADGQLLFPMSPEAAREIGGKLTAPSVVMPGGQATG